MTAPPHGLLPRAELLSSLSLATDLSLGQNMQLGLRSCLLALRVGQELDVGPSVLGEVYNLSLLRWVGCTSRPHELAEWFADRVAGTAPGPRRRLPRTPGAGAFARRRPVREMLLASGQAAQVLAYRLGFDLRVVDAVGHAFERWDGQGLRGARADEIPLAMRVVQVAQDAEFFRQSEGLDAAMEVLLRRGASVYDPDIAIYVARRCWHLFRSCEEESAWEAVMGNEPQPAVVLRGQSLDEALLAVADFVDLQTSYAGQHSREVAALSAGAARHCSLTEGEAARLWRAGLLHDLGAMGLGYEIWQRPGSLPDEDWERVRLHPYHTERMLSRSAFLAPLGRLAGSHHERLDGSGYHRRVGSAEAPLESQILAAADMYQALTQRRPHREAFSPAEAGGLLANEARDGRMHWDAVEGVLAAAGHDAGAGVSGPCLQQPGRGDSRDAPPWGLSAREIQVLRLVALGWSNRKIGEALHISHKTVGHHVQHIYEKLGINNRAAAALFAVEHRLLHA